MPKPAVALNSHATATLDNYNDGPPQSLPALCADLHTRVEAFLAQDFEAENLRSAQAQTRISLGIIREALERYRHTILVLILVSLLADHL